MKKKSVRTWIGICIAIVAFLPVAYMAAWLFIYVPIRTDRAKQQILNADPEALRSACREMITNWGQIKNDANNNLFAEFIFPDRIAYQFGNYGKNMPKIIREMRPDWIDACSNRIEVRVCFLRIGFIGYVEGGEQYDVMDWSKYTMLTNGLWYYDH